MLDLDMGQYGLYVWGSYLVSALVLLATTLGVWREARKARARLAQLQKLTSESTTPERRP
ncbi:MAG: heme exporter protein CcmD [Asticcacaulis sp.]